MKTVRFEKAPELDFFEAKRLAINEIDLDRLKGLFRYHFIESLILAQDERWRRA